MGRTKAKQVKELKNAKVVSRKTNVKAKVKKNGKNNVGAFLMEGLRKGLWKGKTDHEIGVLAMKRFRSVNWLIPKRPVGFYRAKCLAAGHKVRC